MFSKWFGGGHHEHIYSPTKLMRYTGCHKRLGLCEKEKDLDELAGKHMVTGFVHKISIWGEGQGGTEQKSKHLEKLDRR